MGVPSLGYDSSRTLPILCDPLRERANVTHPRSRRNFFTCLLLVWDLLLRGKRKGEIVADKTGSAARQARLP